MLSKTRLVNGSSIDYIRRKLALVRDKVALLMTCSHSSFPCADGIHLVDDASKTMRSYPCDLSLPAKMNAEVTISRMNKYGR